MTKDAIHFYKSEDVASKAWKLFEQEKVFILNLSPDVIVEHVGATSVPGSLTIGDLDIQIRISEPNFYFICEKLKEIYHQNHPNLWTKEFALFHKKDHPEMPMSIVVTVIDSPYD